jgi:serine/threonine protein kinase
MELASSNLTDFLQKKGEESSPSVKYRLCRDVATGLDVLHECRFIHGDLKPDNILIHYQEGHVVAKLADFGLCVDEAASSTTGLRLGGTYGWQAPEVEAGTMLVPSEASQTDNYCFGLLMWSIFLHCGQTPPSSAEEMRQSIAKREIEIFFDSSEEGIHRSLSQTVFQLLEVQPKARPMYLRVLFPSDDDDNEAL